MVREWLAAAGEPRWHGLRVLAADGTCLRLPKWRETQEAYGFGPNGDGSVVMARAVGLLAVASKQMLHAEIGGYAEGERNLLLRALGAHEDSELAGLGRESEDGNPAWCQQP